MYEYKLIKLNNSALPKLWKEWRELTSIYNEIMYFKRVIKQTRNITIDKESPEWLEFIMEYRKINNNGSYAKTLIKKYHEVLKEKPHKEMMEKLEEYKKHLEAFSFKNPVQAPVFLNQKRYLETYEVVKVDYTNKWKDDMLREQKVPKDCVSAIMTENSAWESTHWKVREMTSVVFQGIIDKYYVK